MNKLLVICIVGVALVVGYMNKTNYVKYDGPGLAAPATPEWTDTPVKRQINEYSVKTIGSINQKTRVLWSGMSSLVERGKLTDIVPVQAIVGWGPLSIDENIAHIKMPRKVSFQGAINLTCGGRVSPNMAYDHTAILFFIPKNDRIKQKLHKIKAGEILHISGDLVELYKPPSKQLVLTGFNQREEPLTGFKLVYVSKISTE